MTDATAYRDFVYTNIMNLRKTDDMVEVKVRFHYFDNGIQQVFKVPRQTVNNTPTLFGDIKKIFLPPEVWSDFKLVSMDNKFIPDTREIHREVITIKEKDDEEKHKQTKKSRRRGGGEEEEEDEEEEKRQRKSHRYDGRRRKPLVSDEKLYEKIKEEAKRKFKVWPSAYASSWLVKEYKRRSGKYVGKKPSLATGISRWHQEEWINVCKLPKKVPCGRSKLSKQWKKSYPYCRPSNRINESTPLTASEIGIAEIKKRCSRKRKNPLKKIE
jgi:hypothetical protein